MAEFNYSKRSPLKGGNYWQKEFSLLSGGFQPRKESFFSRRHREMFDVYPQSRRKGVAKSLYDALGLSLSRNLNLEVFKRGGFEVPIGKNTLYGRYRRRSDKGGLNLRNYNVELGARFPVNLQGILY